VPAAAAANSSKCCTSQQHRSVSYCDGGLNTRRINRNRYNREYLPRGCRILRELEISSRKKKQYLVEHKESSSKYELNTESHLIVERHRVVNVQDIRTCQRSCGVVVCFPLWIPIRNQCFVQVVLFSMRTALVIRRIVVCVWHGACRHRCFRFAVIHIWDVSFFRSFRSWLPRTLEMSSPQIGASNVETNVALSLVKRDSSFGREILSSQCDLRAATERRNGSGAC